MKLFSLAVWPETIIRCRDSLCRRLQLRDLIRVQKRVGSYRMSLRGHLNAEIFWRHNIVPRVTPCHFFLLLLTLKFPLSEMREALISWKGLELILVSLNRPHLIQCVFFISSFLKMGGVFFGSWEKKFNSCLSQVFGDEEPEPPKRQKRNSMKRSWV